MKKKILLLVVLCLALFPMVGSAKVDLSKSDFETEAATMLEEFPGEKLGVNITNITVDDEYITFTANGKEYPILYFKGKNDYDLLFFYQPYIKNTMTKAEFDDLYDTLGLALINSMVAHINDVDYETSFNYFTDEDVIKTYSNKIYGYEIIDDSEADIPATDTMMYVKESSFSSKIMDIAKFMYNRVGIVSDVNRIMQHNIWASDLNDAADASLLGFLDMTLGYRNPDFTKMYSSVTPSTPATPTNPKTGTAVKVPNTALSINTPMAIIGLLLVFFGLLSINRIVKRKSN